VKSDSVKCVVTTPQEASHNGKKFSWSQYPHPL